MELNEIFEGVNPAEISQLFAGQKQCLEFLAARKWSGGYVCRKCGNTNYCPGKTPYSRRCTRCKQEESATAHTFFHHCRIHLPDAFRMIYTVCYEPETSSYNLSEQFSLRQMTCWKFKKKIQACLRSKNQSLFEEPHFNPLHK